MSDEKKYRLLIADDERIERAVLYKTLKNRLGDQCEIYQAENGREALELYDRYQIQIAVLDIEMPGINGIGAAEQIREKDKDCCIIFLTAFDEFSYAKKAITVRALDYLLKPWDEKELILVLEEAMRLAGERQQERERRTAGERAGEKAETARGGEGSAQEGQSLDGRRPGGAGPDSAGPGGAGTDRMAPGTTGPDGVRPGGGRPDGGEPADAADAGEGGDAARLSRVMELIADYIRENCTHDLSMQEVAHRMNYSEAYFCKLFKQCFGQNFTSYLTEFRVEEAKKMLALPTVNVKEIGRSVGYADANYFAKVFKRITGQSPTEYRQELFSRP